MSKQHTVEFKLSAELGGNYTKTFSSAQAALVALHKEVQTLSKTQSDINAYTKQQQAVENTQKKLELLRQQYDNIQTEIQNTGGYSSDLENKLLEKQRQIERTTESLERYNQRVSELGDSLQSAGIDISNISNESERLRTDIDSLREAEENVADEAAEMGTEGSNAINDMAEALAISGITEGLQGIMGFFADTYNSAVEFESAMAGVAKTTDFTDEEFAAMSDAIQQLSTEIPITTTELAAVGETAGQLGIAKENLLDFSTTMSMLATATTMTADEAATMLAQFANITQMDPQFYDELGSAIVYLGNSFATTEQSITDMSQGIAASGSLAGMSEADMLGLSAAVSSLGIESQAGATSVSRLISLLLTAVETGDGLEEFASIANMTAAEFTEAWGDNAAGALASFVTGLSDTERNGKSAIVALGELGITETRMQKTILSLSNSGDLLTRAIQSSNTAWQQNTALTDEANKRYATTESQMTMAENAFNNMEVAIGEAFLPVMQKVAAVATDVFGKISEFAKENPALVKAIAAIVASALAFTAAITVAKVAMIAFNAICNMNPFVLIASAVAAAIVGIVALVSSTDEATDSTERLSTASQKQKDELDSLNEEYELLCETQGETSAEAILLKEEIDEQTEAFENAKQTEQEYLEEQEKVLKQLRDNAEAYTSSSDALDAEYEGTVNLIDRLRELTEAEYQTAAAKNEILTIVDLINDRMPGLALTYDALTGILSMSPEEITDVATDDYNNEKTQADYNRLGAIGTLGSGGELDKAWAAYEEASADYKAKVAERDYYDVDNWDAKKDEGGYLYYVHTETGEEVHKTWNKSPDEILKEKYNAKTPAVDTAAKNVNAAVDIYDALVAESGELSNSLAETFAEPDISDVEKAIGNYEAALESLNEAYNESFEAALDSMQGQFELWDEAPKVVATSVSSISDSLQSQLDYWTNYNTNIQTLLQYSGQIEGLSAMLAGLDGSAESVNLVAGMAAELGKGEAGLENIKGMVSAWGAVDAAERTAAGNLADLQTGYTDQVLALAEQLATDIAALNIDDASYMLGKTAIENFIDGAEDETLVVRNAYRDIGRYARLGLFMGLTGNNGGNTGVPFYASGTTSAATGYGIVGENGPELVYFHGGEQVIPAGETEALLDVNNRAAYTADTSEFGSKYSIVYSPVFQIEGSADDEAVLRRLDERTRETFNDLLRDAGIDAARRNYA